MARDTNNWIDQFFEVVKISDNNRFERVIVPILLAIGVGFSTFQLVVRGDFALSGISLFSTILLFVLAVFQPLSQKALWRPFNLRHATYIAIFWVYSLLWFPLFRRLSDLPSSGKQSEEYYVLLIVFFAITFRLVQLIYAISPFGYDMYITRIPAWEKVLVAFNELIAAGILALVGGPQLARSLQPEIFTTRIDPFYTFGMLGLAIVYYFAMQLLWFNGWNHRLGRNVVWVFIARILSPIALVVVTIVITHHFTRLSSSRTANLLGTADINQIVLALSPVVWMMIFYVMMMVYSGQRGLRVRFLPSSLLVRLPRHIRRNLRTISDMDIILVLLLLATYIPIQIFLLDNGLIGFLGNLQAQIADQNSLIDSSEQALSVLFALPFYLIALGLLILYASVMAQPTLSAKDRDAIIQQLPIGFLIIFIITLYMSAIPFSQTLLDGELPGLGGILAFNVLIPLVILYTHYFLLIRLPYGRGQSRWRKFERQRLEEAQQRVEQDLATLDISIQAIEEQWVDEDIETVDEKVETLYQFITINGRRDKLSMERLRIVSEQQQLAEVSETPVSVAVARLPVRIVSLGIPLVLVYKIYEWAILNDGLRQVADDPTINNVFEFFAVVLEQTQF